MSASRLARAPRRVLPWLLAVVLCARMRRPYSCAPRCASHISACHPPNPHNRTQHTSPQHSARGIFEFKRTDDAARQGYRAISCIRGRHRHRRCRTHTHAHAHAHTGICRLLEIMHDENETESSSSSVRVMCAREFNVPASSSLLDAICRPGRKLFTPSSIAAICAWSASEAAPALPPGLPLRGGTGGGVATASSSCLQRTH